MTEAELLKQEEEWELSEEESEQWRYQGIELYRQLVKLNPNEFRYKYQLAQLLLMQGENEKLVKMDFQVAKRIFHEIIRIRKDHALAYYRLAFIYFKDKQWQRSISFFERAIRNESDLSAYKLTGDQQAKARIYLSKSYFELAKSTIETVKESPLSEEISQLLKFTEAEFNQPLTETKKPYRRFTSTGVVFVDEEEYKRIVYPDEADIIEGDIILDYTNPHHVEFICGNHSKKVTEKQAMLLDLLMRNKNQVSIDDLVSRMYHNSANPRNAISKTIERIRERIGSLISEDVIVTTNCGYQFVYTKGNYAVLKKANDVDHELLLD